MTSLTVSVPTAELAADLGDIEGVEVIVWPMEGPAPREQLDIVVPPYLRFRRAVANLRGVSTRLVQGQSIGHEGFEDLLPPGTVFANAATVHETATAELALALILAAQRELVEDVHAQDAGRWQTHWTPGLADRRLLVLGYGGVGKAIVQRLRPFEVDPVVVASRARVEDGVAVHGIDQLPALLPQAEIVVIGLPGGDATRRLVDAEFLTALPEGALVVNVGRGTVVDTDALIAAARAGRIRAALDVVDPEPLPEGHPLWSTPGVLITPHVGGMTAAMRPRIARLVRRQIDRMLAGEPPLNVVLRL